ncbi:hypothetical protein ACIA5A_09640 [Micromonospora sp. NPDC051300]|uniref:hypothetical protein n=1 Tax=Micromonospora sp. NPDC051300 TaxID=3364286 RepID=UPI0037AA1E3A
MSLCGPAQGSAAPGRDGLRSRRLIALLAGVAVTVTTGPGLLALQPAVLHRFGDLAWVVTGAHLAQHYWRPRRTGRLVWRPRIVGRHATEAGLLARRSPAGWLGLATTVALGTVLAVAAVSFLADHWRPVAAWQPLLLAAVSLGPGWAVYREVRFTGRLALTASGIRDGGTCYPWSRVRAAGPNTDDRDGGVMLRVDPAEFPRPVVGGRDVTVSDERLLTAIEQFRVAPETLAVGLPVTAPEPGARGG